jgi:uncharacterized membrane protein YqjE
LTTTPYSVPAADESLTADIRRASDEVRRIRVAVGGIAGELRELGQKEAELARSEMADQAELGRNAAIGGAAAVLLLFVTLVFLGMTVMWGLAEALELWVAALITMALFLALTAGAGYFAMQQARQMTVIPTRTIESLRKDAAWARAQMQPRRQ